MIRRTVIDYEADYVDINPGIKKGSKASLDIKKVNYAINYLKQPHVWDNFMGEGWNEFPGIYRQGGFSILYVLSRGDDEQCIIRFTSLVQLLNLEHGRDDASLLGFCKNKIKKRLEHLKKITKESNNLVEIQDYILIPYLDECVEIHKDNISHNTVLKDYIICEKMEKLLDIDYKEEFCDENDQLDEDKLISYGIQLCNGLLQLNRCHRDIHPGNIMKGIENNGIYKLIDFDSMLDEDRYTTKNVFRYGGNRNYRAPEVKERHYDVRADIYSIGYVLYDLANYNYEKNCFNDDRHIDSHGNLSCNQISIDFLEIIQKACKENVYFRYESVRLLLEDLEKLLKKWRRKKLIRQYDDFYSEWIAEKGCRIAYMKVIANDRELLTEYKTIKKKIYCELYKRKLNIPRILEEYLEDDVFYIIEEYIDGYTLRDILDTELNSDFRINCGRNVIRSICELLNVKWKNKWYRREIISLTSYYNIISPDRIVYTDSGAIYFVGITVPSKVYLGYACEGLNDNYVLPQYYNMESAANIEAADIYAIGILAYEIIMGNSDTGMQQGAYILPTMNNMIDDGVYAVRISEVANACLNGYGSKYTINEILKYVNKFLA